MPKRLLDLFSGAGGAAMGYHRAGFEVVGVDIAPQPHYPFEFHQADALSFSPDGFDAVHASPPCQAFTAYRRAGLVGEHPDLIDAIRQKLTEWGGPWVIENVVGAPLVDPILICGSMFDPPLDVQRHRLFETNWPCFPPTECRHDLWTPRFPPASNRTNLRRTVEIGVGRIPMEIQKWAMDVSWMSRKELTEAIPPAYTEWIGLRLLDLEVDQSRSPYAVFPECPQCGEVEGWQPEHAHWRCRVCGFRDSCCD